MVRTALQEVAAIVTLLSSRSIRQDLDKKFFFIAIRAVNKRFYVFQSECIGQDTAGGVFRFSTTVNADSSPIGHVLNFGHQFLELRRITHIESVSASRDEKVRILQGRIGLRVIRFKRDGHYAGN